MTTTIKANKFTTKKQGNTHLRRAFLGLHQSQRETSETILERGPRCNWIRLCGTKYSPGHNREQQSNQLTISRA